jgi:hypothetical protein
LHHLSTYEKKINRKIERRWFQNDKYVNNRFFRNLFMCRITSACEKNIVGHINLKFSSGLKVPSF